MSSSDEENALYGAVGFIVTHWGHCEQSLELLVNTLFLQYGGNKLPGRKKMPKQLSAKITFVRECILQMPSIAAFSPELEKLVHDFDVVTQIRHNLVHGALTDDPVINGVFTFIRLETHPDIHEVKTFQFDLKEFPLISKTLVRLGADAPRVARRVFDARPKTL